MCRSQKFPIDAQTGPYTVGTPGCQDCPGPNFPLVSKHWYKLHYPALIDFSLTDSARRRGGMRSCKHKQAHLLISGHDPNVKFLSSPPSTQVEPSTKKESYVRPNTTPSPF